MQPPSLYQAQCADCTSPRPRCLVVVGYYGGAPLLDNAGLDLLHVVFNGSRNPADPAFLAATNASLEGHAGVRHGP